MRPYFLFVGNATVLYVKYELFVNNFQLNVVVCVCVTFLFYSLIRNTIKKTKQTNNASFKRFWVLTLIMYRLLYYRVGVLLRDERKYQNNVFIFGNNYTVMGPGIVLKA